MKNWYRKNIFWWYVRHIICARIKYKRTISHLYQMFSNSILTFHNTNAISNSKVIFLFEASHILIKNVLVDCMMTIIQGIYLIFKCMSKKMHVKEIIKWKTIWFLYFYWEQSWIHFPVFKDVSAFLAINSRKKSFTGRSVILKFL